MKVLFLTMSLVTVLGCSSFLPLRKDISKPGEGKSIVFGLFVNVPSGSIETFVRFKNERTGKIQEIPVSPNVSGKPDCLVVAELEAGKYSLIGYRVEDRRNYGTRTIDYFWFRNFQDLKRLPEPITEEAAATFDHDYFYIEANKVLYLGQWTLRRVKPYVEDNQKYCESLVEKFYPNLILKDSKNIFLNINTNQSI